LLDQAASSRTVIDNVSVKPIDILQLLNVGYTSMTA